MEYQITLKDGSVRQISKGTTGYDFAGDLSRTLQKNATVAKWNDEYLDLALPIPGDGTIEFFTFDSPEGKEAFRHTSAHIFGSSSKTALSRHQVWNWSSY